MLRQTKITPISTVTLNSEKSSLHLRGGCGENDYLCMCALWSLKHTCEGIQKYLFFWVCIILITLIFHQEYTLHFHILHTHLFTDSWLNNFLVFNCAANNINTQVFFKYDVLEFFGYLANKTFPVKSGMKWVTNIFPFVFNIV